MTKKTYKIVRFYSDGKICVRKGFTGLTLEQAQAHCSDQKTREDGFYFDGYTEE